MTTVHELAIRRISLYRNIVNARQRLRCYIAEGRSPDNESVLSSRKLEAINLALVRIIEGQIVEMIRREEDERARQQQQLRSWWATLSPVSDSCICINKGLD
jgi:hypothetical protein